LKSFISSFQKHKITSTTLRFKIKAQREQTSSSAKKKIKDDKSQKCRIRTSNENGLFKSQSAQETTTKPPQVGGETTNYEIIWLMKSEFHIY
jgi:hypothetical protein